ncbi:MAG: tyrosine--tRNA ligase [Acholeplasmataceae bacterium]|nr:tyrosine--tRNA ligase [Acholeplasmataceae bacterium]
MKLFDELLWRGMIKDVSDYDLAQKRINEEKLRFYIGFDPTGQSLTVGHLVQIVRMRLMQLHGHIPIVLIGGATGQIGDPREVGERKLITIEDALNNAKLIEQQINKYLDPKETIYVNNYDWISKISLIDFLRDYGKHFNVNYMLAKDIIASRLDSGISYTEFSYMILQSLDYVHLYQNYDCQMQFGGSDQWGNITAGLELIRKMIGENDAIGMSSPLLLKSDGQKFGKSEGGAIWLDPELTSPYEMYQYFLNTADEDAPEVLKKLTLLPIDEIARLEKAIKEKPEEREAQKVLAREITTFVHGEEAFKEALAITEALFSGEFNDLNENSFKTLAKALEGVKVEENTPLVDALVLTKLASSKREAREFISNGAISVNDEKIQDTYYELTSLKALHKNFIILKRGRRRHAVIYFK